MYLSTTTVRGDSEGESVVGEAKTTDARNNSKRSPITDANRVISVAIQLLKFNLNDDKTITTTTATTNNSTIVSVHRCG